MNLQIQKIHFPITTLGFGRRLGVWFQGCSIRCEGCINRDTWEFSGGGEVSVVELVAGIASQLSACDGVTISGGEPLDQAIGMREFIRQIRDQLAGDILIFSGYSKEWIDENQPWIFDAVDVLITDPYDAKAGQTKVLRGSDNQRIFLLSQLASERYSSAINTQLWGNDRRLDLFFEGSEVFMAGIPRPGDMTQLKNLLAGKGLVCKTSDEGL
jgi:anaerobic ribonucleoside-triphosphate reductase activating protein